MTDTPLDRGEIVTITAGPLKGWNGYIQESNSASRFVDKQQVFSRSYRVLAFPPESTPPPVPTDTSFGLGYSYSTTTSLAIVDVWVSGKYVEKSNLGETT